jgi:hypothetical protein
MQPGTAKPNCSTDVHWSPDAQLAELMARPNEWVKKILVLLQAGNTAAAIAQIKVAPSAKDVRALQSAQEAGNLLARSRDVNEAIQNSFDALSAPRLHRSP